MKRPTLEDVELYLAYIEAQREERRRLLEDIGNVEDCPETDEAIRKLVRGIQG